MPYMDAARMLRTTYVNPILHRMERTRCCFSHYLKDDNMYIVRSCHNGDMEVKPHMLSELRILLCMEATRLLKEAEEHQKRWIASKSDSDLAKRRRCLHASDAIGKLMLTIQLPFPTWQYDNAAFTTGEFSEAIAQVLEPLLPSNPNDADETPQ